MDEEELEFDEGSEDGGVQEVVQLQQGWVSLRHLCGSFAASEEPLRDAQCS